MALITVTRLQNLDLLKRMDAFFYQRYWYELLDHLVRENFKPLAQYATLRKETRNASKKPNVVFHYIDINNVDRRTGIIIPQEIIGSEAPSRARKVVRAGDVIVSTVRPESGFW